jgi:hypothetical protein
MMQAMAASKMINAHRFAPKKYCSKVFKLRLDPTFKNKKTAR